MNAVLITPQRAWTRGEREREDETIQGGMLEVAIR